MKANQHKSKLIEDSQVYHKTKIYLLFFYFWGHSTVLFCNDSQQNSLFYKFIKKVPVTLWILIAVLLFIKGTILFHEDFEREGLSSTYESLLYLCFELIVAITIFSQCFIHEEELQSALEHCEFLTNYFRQKLHVEIPLNKFLRKFRWNFFKFGSLVIMQEIAFRLYTPLAPEDNYLNTIIDVLQIPMIILTMHSIFYLNLLVFMMSQLNSLIAQQHICRVCKHMKHNRKHTILMGFSSRRQICNDVRLTLIKQMKLIYYRIWRATKLINDFFGWSIAAIFIQNFVFLSLDLYWVYVILVNKTDMKDIMYSMIGPFFGMITPGYAMLMIANTADQLHLQVILIYFEQVYLEQFIFSCNSIIILGILFNI